MSIDKILSNLSEENKEPNKEKETVTNESSGINQILSNLSESSDREVNEEDMKLTRREEKKLEEMLKATDAPMNVYEAYFNESYEEVVDYIKKNKDKLEEQEEPEEGNPEEPEESNESNESEESNESNESEESNESNDPEDSNPEETKEEKLSMQERMKTRKLLDSTDAPIAIYKALYNHDYEVVAGFLKEELDD